MRTAAVTTALISLLTVSSAAAQEEGLDPYRFSVGGSLLGFAPQGDFAKNVDFAGGAGGHFLVRLDPAGIAAIRADLSFLVYGHERYRVPLGGGPLGLIQVDVNTTNSIFAGGLGLQLLAPGPRVRPYANASVGFSYFVTSSSVEGTESNEDFASSTNYEDGGFAWTVGGGLYIPLYARRTTVSLDIGARWIDNGERDYLRDDGITFVNNEVQLNPVSSKAKGLQYMLGITVTFGARSSDLPQ